VRMSSPPRLKVTIADVARKGGVSQMTISRVINDPASVAEGRRRLVLQAIEALHYSPNPAARALAGGRPVRLALFYDNPSTAFLSTFLLGSLEAAQRQHAQLTVIRCQSGAEKKAVLELLGIAPKGFASAAALRFHQVAQDDSVRGLLAVSVPAERASPKPLPFASTISRRGCHERHIVDLGHRRIGFISGNPDQIASAERARGYRSALSDARIELDEALIAPGLFTYRSGLIACESLLELPDPPTAVFASNDDMAAAAISVAHRRHLDVPADFTVCGFDDTHLARSIWPELTTVRQPVSDMAAQPRRC